MRFINKGNEPQSLTAWKDKKTEDWVPDYKLLSNPQKTDLYNALLLEQGFICCYCENELNDNDYHIEHLNPQAARTGDDLDFSNLLCSCLRNTDKRAPLHCGKKKENFQIPVTPLQTDCQDKFTFTANGKIDGINRDAKKTIRVLALDISKLNDLREKVLEAFIDADLTDNELKEFVKSYVAKREKLKPFISTIEYVFRDYIEDY